MEETRRCEVKGFHEKGNFVKFGQMVITDEGNNYFQRECAIVELDSGQVIEVEPSWIKFIK